MEKQQWIPKNRQAVAMDLEQTDDYLNNGITDNLLENGDKNSIAEDGGKSEDKIDRNSRIRQAVEAAVSDLSRKTIENILDQVKTLTPTEHLLLYLKLPTECSNAGDPLRQPLNPLGSRSEISQTIMWIKTHLEEDPELSLPKQDVYNEYYAFCGPNKIKPLSTADFGKVMKQVYPKVRPRRLGTRGNSRYCYAGLRRRLKLDPPLLPDLSDKPQSSEVSCSSTDLLSAAWTIVKEWSERQLGMQFSSLQTLACYLVLNLSIGNGSGAAALVTSAAKSPFKQGDAFQPSFVCSNKHREAQLQLQRKLQQRNEISRSEQKRKMQLQSPKVEPRMRGSKRCKMQNQQSAAAATANNSSSNNNNNTSPTSATLSDINASPSQGLQTICDKSIDFTNLQALPDFSSFQKTAPAVTDQANEQQQHMKQTNGSSNGGGSASENNNNANEFVPKSGKVAIPRLSTATNPSKFSPLSSPKRAKNVKYKAIQPKPESCDIGVYNPQLSLNAAADYRSQETTSTTYVSNPRANKPDGSGNNNKRKSSKGPATITCKTEMETSLASLDVSLPRERLISISDIDKSALDDYLGTSNSQEQEEELVKYFENNKEKSPSEQDVTTKLSQLRQLLITQQNLNVDPNTKEPDDNDNNLNLTSLLTSDVSAFTKTSYKNTPDLPNLNPVPSSAHYYLKTCQDVTNYSAARRRVSFEMLQQEDAAVPPSPNTRRKNFNFTPISPGPLSPNGRQSKCSSATVSPFVSPRITPVPRAKNNAAMHQQNVSASYVVNPRKPVKPALKIKQENVDAHAEMAELLVATAAASTDTAAGGYLPMSAPASPKLPVKSSKNSNLLQKLLNSSNKVAYTPNYTRSQSLTGSLVNNDSLSTEISQFFSNSISQLNLETGYRSQSVPLHQMAFKSSGGGGGHHQHQSAVHHSSPLMVQNPFPGADANPFPFLTASMPSAAIQQQQQISAAQNEFGDFDSFSASENVNMNKILSTLDVGLQNPATETNNMLPSGCNEIQNVFTGMSDLAVSLNNNNLPSLSRGGFELEYEQRPNLPPLSVRGLGRSQSIDVDMGGVEVGSTTAKYNPSRSVPGTPVPYSGSKSNTLKNYRSYPSTPLTMNETFCYNHGQDYLLNGQPIKEKVDVVDPSDLRFFQGSESNDEDMYQNMFNVNDAALNCDILMGGTDNKNHFNFESSQLPENNYGPKNNNSMDSSVLDEGCIVMNGGGHNYDFKNSTGSG